MLTDTESVRVIDVAMGLDVSKATAHRILQTLAARNFLARDSLTRRYSLGSAVRKISQVAVKRFFIEDVIHPHLEQLASKTGETIHFLRLERSSVRFIDGVEGHHDLRIVRRIGAILPAHSTSSGKVILAFSDRQRVRRLYKEGLSSVTKDTITDPVAFEMELNLTKERGYGLNLQENETGLSAISVPVFGTRNIIEGALTISIPASRLDQDSIAPLVRTLKQSARSITENLLASH